MKTAVNKTNFSPHVHQSGKPFFQKNGENAFFTDWQTDLQTKPFFSRQMTKPFVQPKLTIGRSGDKYEHEADRVADAVISPNRTVPAIQQKCTDCGQEDKLQTKRRTNSNSGLNIKKQLSSRQSMGRLLPGKVQSEMGRTMGSDFKDVNIHTDTKAIQMNRALGARAFTHGRDIYFNRGEYNPASSEGKHLLAHELVHVVQQNYAPESQQVQRTIGDGHDLQSPRFSRDLKLEAAFDDEDLVKKGEQGMHIVKLQQALVDLGYPLTNFGVDGIFGSETEGSIRAYQNDHSLAVDGIVGPETIGRLDEHYKESDPPPVCPIAPATDTAVAFASPAKLVEVSTSPAQCQVPGGGGGTTINCPTPATSGVTPEVEPADNFSGRSKTRVGTGEIVNLFFNSFLSRALPRDRKAEVHGGLKWVQTSGPGALTSGVDGSGIFTADQNDGKAELELHIVVGPCAGTTVARVQLDVVKPANAFMVKEAGTTIAHKKGTWSIGFIGLTFLEPNDVSFRGIEFQEGAVRAVRKGFLSDLTPETHPEGSCPQGPGNFCTVTGGDAITGSRVASRDEVFSGLKHPPFSVGSFKWDIPFRFRVGGTGTGELFTIATQLMTADAAGTATIEKKGAGPFSRAEDDPTTGFTP